MGSMLGSLAEPDDYNIVIFNEYYNTTLAHSKVDKTGLYMNALAKNLFTPTCVLYEN